MKIAPEMLVALSHWQRGSECHSVNGPCFAFLLVFRIGIMGSYQWVATSSLHLRICSEDVAPVPISEDLDVMARDLG
jgi:hypothetical protein